MAADVEKSSNFSVIAEALRAHAPQFRRFVSARVPTGYVDDILQSAAMRAIERCETLKDPTRVLPWLYRIHRNVLANTLRKRAVQERRAKLDLTLAFDESTCVADAPCSCSLVQAQNLRESYATILNLVDAGDASIAEAARTLGISTNNATVRLHRARRALRAAMLDHCGVASARECAECRCVIDGCCAT